MSQREANMVLLRDLLEHLTECHKQLEWSDDPEMIRLLTEAMLRDLERCRRQCESLHRRCQPLTV
jgi:hypothetical protein